jgi:CDP-diacylglycerol--glycerol-3-phosphate 3-phosphatidyltransferase
LVATDHLVAAGVLYLIAGTLDLLDGMIARLTGTPTRFGAFLDSTIDRFSEGVVFAAIGYRFALEGAAIDAGVVVVALLGSFLVSYTRAKAEGLGVECKVGIATRAERVVLVAVGLVAGLLTQVIYLVALLTAITIVQRVMRVRRELRSGR